jgi:hypothetical protein
MQGNFQQKPVLMGFAFLSRFFESALEWGVKGIRAKRSFRSTEKSANGQKRFFLKGHGNEADFLGLLQKLVPHRSLTLPFEPFRFGLRICGDIHNRKKTLRLSESGSRRVGF